MPEVIQPANSGKGRLQIPPLGDGKALVLPGIHCDSQGVGRRPLLTPLYITHCVSEVKGLSFLSLRKRNSQVSAEAAGPSELLFLVPSPRRGSRTRGTADCLPTSGSSESWQREDLPRAGHEAPAHSLGTQRRSQVAPKKLPRPRPSQT